MVMRSAWGKPGTYLASGSSSRITPSCTSPSTTVATNILVMLATRSRSAGRSGTKRRRSARPAAPAQLPPAGRRTAIVTPTVSVCRRHSASAACSAAASLGSTAAWLVAVCGGRLVPADGAWVHEPASAASATSQKVLRRRPILSRPSHWVLSHRDGGAARRSRPRACAWRSCHQKGRSSLIMLRAWMRLAVGALSIAVTLAASDADNWPGWLHPYQDWRDHHVVAGRAGQGPGLGPEDDRVLPHPRHPMIGPAVGQVGSTTQKSHYRSGPGPATFSARSRAGRW